MALIITYALYENHHEHVMIGQYVFFLDLFWIIDYDTRLVHFLRHAKRNTSQLPRL